MPPLLALALTLLFIAFIFQREFKQPYSPSWAIWIPCLWMLILGSRSVGQWLNLGEPSTETFVIEEGSPIDRAVFFLLIIAGLIVLWKRHISWSHVFRNNLWLTIFFLYCGVSILWSDFPFVAFKRWTKGFGDPIMMLIILTEQEPLKAFERLLTTCTYILIPLSILFIKYFPSMGKAYDDWEGNAFYTGVTTNKNLLGFVLLISGLFLVSRLHARWEGDGKSGKWIDDIGIPFLLLFMVGWLFKMADSKTSLIGLGLGVFLYVILGRQNVRKYTGRYIVAAVLAFFVLEASVDLTALLITSAGRDTTLTGRTVLWEMLLNTDSRPMLGHGFESFWLGDRLRNLQAQFGFKPNQAHNGYIELYLNLGWIGLFVLAGVIVSSFMKIRRTLTSSSEMRELVRFGRFGMAFLATFLAYNCTEAAFKSLHFLFVIFLLFTIEYRPLQQKIIQTSSANLLQGGAKLAPVRHRSFSSDVAPEARQSS
jgi:exopolysaccharide production protein ExoQ